MERLNRFPSSQKRMFLPGSTLGSQKSALWVIIGSQYSRSPTVKGVCVHLLCHHNSPEKLYGVPPLDPLSPYYAPSPIMPPSPFTPPSPFMPP